MFTARELKYLEACMMVADGEGEHASEYGIDIGEFQVKLTDEIVMAEGADIQKHEVSDERKD